MITKYFTKIIISMGIILFSITIQAQISFTNVAQTMGIDITAEVGLMGYGVSFCDFNGDGLDDISLCSELGKPIHLFRNDGNTFTEVTSMLSMVDSVRTFSLLWADYDNDGDKDLFLANHLTPNKLFRNDNNTQFVDVTATSGLSPNADPSTAACWGDINNDGYLDLYVGNREDAYPNVLYKNLGDGTFEDITQSAGVGDADYLPLAMVFVDYDNDGLQDIYIANDKQYGNTLFRNLGGETFENVSVGSNANLEFDAMGIAVGDYDNDLDLDMYVSNSYIGNGLLRNNSNGTFTDVADSLNILVERTCWGTDFSDFDNDLDLDLIVAVSFGDSPTDPRRQNFYYENLGDGTFDHLTNIGLDSVNNESYTLAVGDINNDGALDIAVMNASPTKFALWENIGNSNNWLKIQLEGTISNRDGVGSLLQFYVGDQTFIRSVHCGTSFLSQNSAIQTIGLAQYSQVDSIKVTWLSGITDMLYNLPVNQQMTIVEGSTVGIKQPKNQPKLFKLFSAYPNPFNPETTVAYSLNHSAHVKLKIFNLLGKKIHTLVDERQSFGEKKVVWDGRNQFGSQVSSGVYIIKLSVANQIESHKIILLR